MLLSLAAGEASGQYFGQNKIAYRTFDWKIYHSPHFDVYYYTEDEPSLEKVVSFAESAYDELSREFDFQIKEPIPLDLLRDPLGVRAEQRHPELHPRGRGRLRRLGAASAW